MSHQERNKLETSIEQPIEEMNDDSSETLSSRSKRVARSFRQASRAKKLAIGFVVLWATGMLGLAFGYSVIGDGSFVDAFKPGTYKHMYDLVFKTNP